MSTQLAVNEPEGGRDEAVGAKKKPLRAAVGAKKRRKARANRK